MEREDERLAEARREYLAAHERLNDVARRYFALDPRTWARWREEYHDAMLAAVRSAIALHAVESGLQREHEAFFAPGSHQ